MDFLTLIQALRRSWWILVLSLGVVVGSTAYFTAQQTAVFEASTTLIVGPRESVASVDDIVDSLNALDRRTILATYAKIPSSQTVQAWAREQRSLSPEQMKSYRVRTSVLPDTNILKISVEGPDPQMTAALANTVADLTSQQAKQVYRIYGLKVLDPATPPADPVRPRPARNLGVGAVLGLFLGVGLASLTEAVRQRERVTKGR